MKKILSALFVTVSIFLNSAYGIPISADLNISTPTTLSGQTNLIPDFNIDSDEFIIDNLTLL